MSGPAKHFVADPSPWTPESDAVALMHLGKLGEELAECGAAVSRCIIQGIDQAEPSTGEVNRDWLTKEIADVLANVALVREFFGLDQDGIEVRVAFKTAYLRRWHSGSSAYQAGANS